MREIKFRAWDKQRKAMETCVAINPFYIGDCDRRTWKHDEIELMQYTCLKDKNGTEIYEGDIVKRTSGLIGDEYDEFTGIVKFNCASFILESFDGKDGTWLWNDVQELEVIGNIYKNPELIEQSRNGWSNHFKKRFERTE